MNSEYKKLNELKEEIAEVGKLIYNRGLSSGTSGNISIRHENNILITPSGSCLGELTAADVVDITCMEGYSTEGNPSSEKIMHSEIYKARPDTTSIIHAHRPKATAYAIAGIPLNMPVLAEAVVLLGQVPIAEYAAPSFEKLGICCLVG